MQKDNLKLAHQFIKSPQSVGTMVPSSRNLAKAMLKPINFKKISTIVELGPGSGALTAIIAEKLPAGARYLGFELNKELFESLAARFPHFQFVNKDASDIVPILKSLGIEGVDAIVCGLPWASLPSQQQPVILDGVTRCLCAGGVFVTYAYLLGLLFPSAWNLRRRLRNRFSSVESTRIIWNNVPPAFAYICRR